MIRVSLTMCPGGFEGEEYEQHLGTIYISNDVMKTLFTDGKRGTYKFELFKKIKGRVAAKGRVVDFPRQAYHPWELVRRLLNQVAEANGGHV